MKFHVFSDSNHAWLKVPTQLLESLDIAGKVSKFSYIHGKFVYLEEDFDAPLLVTKLEEIGIKVKLVEHHSDRSRIRQYSPYTREP